MPDISKIKMPSGNYYDIKDKVAREAIAGGISFILAWKGDSVPVPANIPAGVKVEYQGQTYTGTLAASAAQPGGFYLVKSATQVGELDAYDEYAVITVAGVKGWEKIGDTHIDLSIFGDLAYKDNVTIVKGSGDNVLGEDTTFEASPSAVSFTGGSSKDALGADATFDVSYQAAGKSVYGSAKDTEVGVSSTEQFVQTIGESSAKMVTGEVHDTPTLTKKYLATKKVNEVAGNADVSIPNVTNVQEVSVPVVASNTARSIPNVTSVGSASTWNFALGTGDEAETLIISGANGSAPTLGTAITATDTSFGTASSASKVTLGTALSASKVTTAESSVASGQVSDTTDGAAIGVDIAAGAVKTFATGAVASDGAGASVVTGVSPTKGAAATAVAVTKQPIIDIYATVQSPVGHTGKVGSVTEVADISVSVDSADTVSAVTSIGTGTAAAQEITVGANDKVKVAKYDDLGVSVS